MTVDALAALRSELRQLLQEHAVRHGTFILASGMESRYFFDGKRVTLSPRGARLTGQLVFELLRNGGQNGLIKISGPEKVLSVLKKRVSQIAVDVEYLSEEEGIEVTVEAQHTTIRSAFAPWADLIASLGEPG